MQAVERASRRPRGRGDQRVDVLVGVLAVLGPHQARPAGVGLDPADDGVHHRHRLARIGPGRRFGRQHQRVGALVDAAGDVGGLGAGRGRGGDHRFQHLGGDDHRRAAAPGGADDALLHHRHLLRRQLDAEVAARHHDAVADVEDGLQIVAPPPASRSWPAPPRGPRRCARSAATSPACCTNDSAIQSTPIRSANSASVWSLEVSAGTGIITPGTASPLWSESASPASTSTSAESEPCRS